MSKLIRMNLHGIRSFGSDEDDVQGIKFLSPLTLIQGQNGSGKTTIIEAIKFAISGELPGGSSKGQGFVFDPKLANSFESYGQIKLRVLDTKGENVTVLKVVRVLLRGADKLEFKRLDSSVSRGKISKPRQSSNKCVDVDTEMCLALGVSKAIINNVIFCHQEDSNWPLEESKKLKERFDEIFDATKYNKCLEMITKFVKINTEKLKITKVELSGLLDKKKIVEAKKKSFREKQGKLAELTDDMYSLQAEIEPVDAKIQKLQQIEMDFTKLYTSVELKKKEVLHLNLQQAEILQNIKEFPGTDEELKIKVAEFKDDLLSFEKEIDILKDKKVEIEKLEQNTSSNMNVAQNKLGGLQVEERQNLCKIKQRNEFINSNVNDFNLEEVKVTDDNTNQNIIEIINAFKNHLQLKKTEMCKLQISFEMKEEQVQKEIDEAREQYAQLKQNIASKSKLRNEGQEELIEIKSKLEELNTADDQLKLVDGKLQRIEREIKAIEFNVNTDQLKSQINVDKTKLKNHQEKLLAIENEITELQQYFNIQTEVDIKGETLLGKQNDLKKLKNKHKKSFQLIFDTEIPENDLKNHIERFHQNQTALIKDFTNKINQKQRDVLKIENILSTLTEKLNDKKKELSSNQNIIKEHCENKPLNIVMKSVQDKLEKLQNDKGIYFSSKYIYQKFIQQFQDNEPCPLCKRHVEEKTLAKQVINELKKKIEDFPNKLNIIDMELSNEQKRYQTIITLKPVNENINKLNTEIPALQIDIEKNTKILTDLTDNLNSLKSELSTYQKNEEIANLVMGDSSVIDNCQQEVQSLKQQILDLQKKLPRKELSLNNRGFEEVLNEKETLNIDIRSIQNNIESSQAKLTQHFERLQKLREQKNELIYLQLSIKKSLQDKVHLVTKSVEIENKITELNSDLLDLEKQAEPMDNNLKIKLNKKEDLKTNNKKQLEKSQEKLNSLQKILNEILNMQSTIEEFNRKNIGEQIENVKKSISNLKNKLNMYSDKKTELENKTEELKLQIANSRQNYRELTDNIQLREKRTKAENLKILIEDERKKLGENNIIKVRREKNELLEKEANLRKMKHTIDGKRSILLESIKELDEELQLQKNVRAAYEYKKKCLEYMVSIIALDEMKDFARAMDWALMQYHKERMKQVNSIIKELWRSIYKGNDVDYIEIKTEDNKTIGQDRRKIYSYKVIQVKNKIELDMKGRCSAGQRVLASLIIRIALAETFSCNCGILALDEPTTNLDRENINSLSEALVELIKRKKQQKNFQLLVITHDQDFVERLTRAESLDKYYVVKRNELGRSLIVEHLRN